LSITRRALAATILVVALVAGVLAVSADGQKKKTYVLDVGDTQGIDSMNVTVGVTVPAYEAWNLQYPTLTDKAAEDFHPIPALAQSWEGSKDGKTWTYKLRPNLKWSDGKPLTSDDVVYTVNRSKKEEWINHSSVVANLTASAPDKNTVVIKTSVPDPKLPTMDVYIVPKHIFQKYDAAAIKKYDATDGVGAGPFVLEKFEKGQFARFRANPYYWKGKPAIDKVVLRFFNNPDAMVAALKSGELDAAEDVPGAAFHQLEKDKNIQTIQGFQGAMNEFAVNGGDGLKKPHPALLDPRVRQAIAHAIDKKTIVDRVMSGLAKPGETLSTSPDTSWTPDIPSDQLYDFDIAKAKQILDDAGYKDTNGDGIREMPGGGKPLKMKYLVRTEGDTAQPTAEFITGWLKEIGIATTRKSADDSQMTELIGKGDYDMFSWGWTPFVDPDPMLSYFKCDQIASDPKDPTNYYNDANFCDKEYDKLYDQQHTELDKAKRKEIVHEMLTRFQKNAVYDVLYTYPDLQAYVKGRFTGWVRQPADTGPVLFTNTSPTYAVLKPITASSEDSGGSGGIIAIVVVAVLLVGGLVLLARRRRTAYERE
jgi:peptide/nickel transport system substrate-binding protein